MTSNFQLNDNEKFACLAFEGVHVADDVPTSVCLGNNVWVLQKNPFTIDKHWKAWLGSLKMDDFENSTLLIVAKMPSQTAEILDGENEYLQNVVHTVWYSILLDGIPNVQSGLVISGTMRNRELDVRSAGTSHRYYCPDSVMPKQITKDTVVQAEQLSMNLQECFASKGNFIRFKKGWHSWLDGLREDRGDSRLHKFVRVMEAVIKPRIGKTSKDFVHRAKFFLKHTDADNVLDELYGIRCSVEHLNDWQESLLQYSESERGDIASLRSYQAQLLASAIIKKFLLAKDLWPIIKEDAALDAFWSESDHVKAAKLDRGYDIEATCKTEFKPYV